MDMRPDFRRTAPPGAAFGEWRAPDGWRLRRMDRPQAPGAEVRGSLLFAGGRSDFIEKYFEALDHWHARGWNVTSFDWRGQGASRGNIVGGHIEDFGLLAADLAALIAEWRAACPGPHVVICHSMGGHVLLRTLVEHRPVLDAAVLVAPMIAVNAGPIPGSLAARIAALLSRTFWNRRPLWRRAIADAPGSLRQRRLTSSIERYADELWWRARDPGYNLGAPSWGWIAAAYRSAAQCFTPDRLAQVGVPILLIGTDGDRLVDPRAIRRAAAHLPRAELAMLPDSRHEILRERDEVRLAALARIDGFLDRYAAA